MAGTLSAWTHHHLLKATASVKFNQGRLARGAMNTPAVEVLKELTRARESFLEQVGNPASSAEIVVRASNDYIALLVGLENPPTSDGATQPGHYAPQYPDSGPSTGGGDVAGGPPQPKGPGGRARTACMFQWRDVISGKIVIFEDSQAELICTLLNVGLWHCMHASRLQASAKPDDDEMTKEIYHTMRRAASYFDCVHGSQLDRFTFKQIPGSAFTTDLDARIVQCMAEQCLAEAQEVTLNRARLKGHTAAIMAGIALDERDRFRAAKKHILQMDKALVEDLWAYFDFKIFFYDAYALWANGEDMFKKEECADSIKCYDEASTKMKQCRALADEFTKRRKKRKALKNADSKPVTESEVFIWLEKAISTSLSKAKHEHSFIYTSQRIPATLPELLPSKSLVQKEQYAMPERSSLWNEAQFDQSKIPARGTNRGADLASSDEAKVKNGAHTAQGVADDAFCVVM